MLWWSSQQKRSSGGHAPAAATAIAGGAGAGDDVPVQKVPNLAPKVTFHGAGPGKIKKLESIKEDINKRADRFIQRTKAKFNQSKSFQHPSAATGRGG
uniref:Uncharacterized protein n=1 Tax=Leersia perrieri TaxID=77586 RepID=A0A0D9WCL8_9ORYZ